MEAAKPEHPSLIDTKHQMDALFGVVNIPDVVWIDEQGVIVRPPEPGWAGPQVLPDGLLSQLKSSATKSGGRGMARALTGGQDRQSYPDAIRDWVANGSDSQFWMSPAEVIEASQPRSDSESEGAAHFELANHFWQLDERQSAIEHFNACHELQPKNWTYKRQAWSLVGNEREGGDYGRFVQVPAVGSEEDWPFVSDMTSDSLKVNPGEYYPNTMS